MAKTAPTGWDIWGKDPWTATEGGAYFATFGPHMPDFNFRNPKVLAYHEDSLRFWLNRGLDGVRLDAVPHLIENSAKNWNDQPQSRALTRRLQRLITHYPRRYVVCEATAKPEIYGSKKVCGSAFAFGHQNNIVAAAKAPDAAATDADLAKRRAAIQSVAHYFEKAPPNMATMVSNHDAFAGLRLWDQVGGDLAAYRLAAATYLLQPGTPFIYYGEEVGMAGTPGLQGDSPLRGPMSWTADAAGFTSGTPFRAVSANVATHNAAAQVGDAASIHSFYKSMLSLRNTLPSIVRGSYARAFVQGEVIGFQRRLGQEKTWVLINYGTQAASVSVAKAGALSHWLAQYPRASEALLADAKGGLKVLLPAQSVQVYLLQYK